MTLAPVEVGRSTKNAVEKIKYSRDLRLFKSLREAEKSDYEARKKQSIQDKFIETLQLSAFGKKFYGKFHRIEELDESFNFLKELLFDVPKYAIVGAIASNLWGVPRFTKDIEVLVALSEKVLEKILIVANSFNFGVKRVPETDPDLIRFFKQGVEFVDIIIAKELDYFETVLDRAVTVESPYGNLKFASAEDIIILKLIAGRLIDMADIERILRVRDDVDMEYVRYWAHKWGTEQKLDEILKIVESER